MAGSGSGSERPGPAGPPAVAPAQGRCHWQCPDRQRPAGPAPLRVRPAGTRLPLASATGTGTALPVAQQMPRHCAVLTRWQDDRPGALPVTASGIMVVDYAHWQQPVEQ